MHVRKNAASMTSNEISKFMNAILELKKKPATVTATGTPTNVYDQFVAIHDGVVGRTGAAIGNGGHRGPAFCAWHREYILRFEQQLQIIDSDVFLPYWSWESGNASDTDSIFVDAFMGPRERITSGYLSETPNSFNPDGWRVNPSLDGNGSGTRLTRNSFSSSDLTQIADDGRNSLGQTPFTGTNGFRRSLESPHDRIHGRVGGHMTAMTSPNDPIFFLHHANVDRLWAKWQLNNPGDVNYPSTFGRVGHALNDLMWPWDGGASQTNRSRALPFLPPVNNTDLRRPRDVLDIEALDYTYDDAVGSSGWGSGSTPSLNPPTNFSAQNPTTNTIDLVWEPPRGGTPHTGYVIRRRVQNTGTLIEIVRPSRTDTNYTDTGLQSRTTYEYELRSVDATNESAPSTDSETTGRCFIITATYDSELAPQAQFVHEFIDGVVLKSKFKKSFERFLQIYFKISPSIANLMYRNKPFKYAMKYSIVLPFIALARITAFLVNPFVTRKIKR